MPNHHAPALLTLHWHLHVLTILLTGIKYSLWKVEIAMNVLKQTHTCVLYRICSAVFHRLISLKLYVFLATFCCPLLLFAAIDEGQVATCGYNKQTGSYDIVVFNPADGSKDVITIGLEGPIDEVSISPGEGE
jgi:hypothetical protein